MAASSAIAFSIAGASLAAAKVVVITYSSALDSSVSSTVNENVTSAVESVAGISRRPGVSSVAFVITSSAATSAHALPSQYSRSPLDSTTVMVIDTSAVSSVSTSE